ncbi:MAG: helix-turn-helix domain-containing protein [Cyanobacteria bacterium RI_101]|nr:helix-turn-helix domain-containing protein [Cyanobacteria bacterium RI_101]
MVKKSFSLDLPYLNFSYRYRQFDDSLSFFTNLNCFQLDICQLSAGRFQGSSVEISSPNVRIDRHLHTRLMKLEGAPVKTWAFAVPMFPIWLLFDDKYQLEDNYILLGPPQSEFKMIQKSAYGVYLIYFSEAFFFQLCENYHLPEPTRLLGSAFFNTSALSASRQRLLALRRSLSQLFERASFALVSHHRDSFLYPYLINDFIDQLETHIAQQLMAFLAESQEIKPKKTTLKRSAALRQAEAFMESCAQADITAADIGRAAGVSQRTLEYTFREFYGLSPKAYLKQWRLNRFRLALREQAPQGGRVNEIGAEWGFWHSGQLARDYYRLFGELPSQTLSVAGKSLVV